MRARRKAKAETFELPVVFIYGLEREEGREEIREGREREGEKGREGGKKIGI